MRKNAVTQGVNDLSSFIRECVAMVTRLLICGTDSVTMSDMFVTNSVNISVPAAAAAGAVVAGRTAGAVQLVFPWQSPPPPLPAWGKVSLSYVSQPRVRAQE